MHCSEKEDLTSIYFEADPDSDAAPKAQRAGLETKLRNRVFATMLPESGRPHSSNG
jgi:hypothetical protein